jgi:hypothetical protein
MGVIDFAARRKQTKEMKDFLVPRFILYPKHWNEFADPNVFSWTRVRFDAASEKTVPNDQRGV